MTDPKVTQDGTELEGMDAVKAMSGEFERILYGITAQAQTEAQQIAAEPDYRKVAIWAGYAIWASERGVTSDLWSAYDRLHEGLGVGLMDWTGPHLITSREINTSTYIGFLLRGIGAVDVLRHISESDKALRAHRRDNVRSMEMDAEAQERMIDYRERNDPRDIDQAARKARLQRLRDEIRKERLALGLSVE